MMLDTSNHENDFISSKEFLYLVEKCLITVYQGLIRYSSHLKSEKIEEYFTVSPE